MRKRVVPKIEQRTLVGDQMLYRSRILCALERFYKTVGTISTDEQKVRIKQPQNTKTQLRRDVQKVRWHMRFFTRATLAFDDRIPYDLSFALKEIFVELGIATVHGTTSLLKFLSSDLGKIERLAKEKSVPFPLVLKILHEKGNGR